MPVIMNQPLPDGHPFKGTTILSVKQPQQQDTKEHLISEEEDEKRAFAQRQYGYKHGNKKVPSKDPQE